MIFSKVIKPEPIVVVDAICGAGKTSFMIQQINQSPANQKWVYITPYLDEVERIKQSTRASRRFTEPEFVKGKTKLSSLKELLREGRNIATTHSLFYHFDRETLDLISLQNYKLCLDEVTTVIEPLDIKKGDVKLLLRDGIIKADENGAVYWNTTKEHYDGQFSDRLKPIIQSGKVYLHGGNCFLWLFPVEVFQAFREVTILTFLWEGQMMSSYFKLHGIPFVKKSVGKKPHVHMTLKDMVLTVKDIEVYELIPFVKAETKHFKELIQVEQDSKLNDIGFTKDPRGYDKLTFTRLNKLKKTDPIYRPLKNNLYNWFRHRNSEIPSENCMWTVPKKIKGLVQPSGYVQGFVPSNARSSNQWRNKEVVAYMLNKFPNPVVVGFFADKGVGFDSELYAVSELLQFLFRSRLRENKPIRLYLPSQRMRELLNQWIDQE